MSEHGHPGWYSWLVVVGGALVSMLTAVSISVSLGNQQREREREREAAEAQRASVQRELNRAATCLVIRTMADVYSDPAPITVTGEKAALAWRKLGQTFGCKE
jgi:hypothetical protein